MSTRTEPRPIPTDATLVWLASERAAPLFRTLDRVRAFNPLVVLLAMLPPVLATFAETVTMEDAAWGLRALGVTGSAIPPQVAANVEMVVPAETVRPAALRLTAALLRSGDPARPGSGSLASLLGGVALLAMLWPLARSLAGRRFAFWAVLLAAFHPTLTALLRDPAPVTVGLALAALAFWAHLNLAGKRIRYLPTWATAAVGVAGGLLFIGPAALAVPFIMVADAGLALILPEPAVGVRSSSRATPTKSVEMALRRLTAAAAGTAIWGGVAWFGSGDPLAATPPGVSSPEAVAEEASAVVEAVIVGPLWGLAAIGLGRLLRILHRRSARLARLVPRLALVWLIVGGAAVLWIGQTNGPAFNPAGRYVAALATLPLLLTAAYGIEEASRRAVSGAWVLLAVSLPLAVRLGSLMATIRVEGPATWLMWGVLAAAMFWGVSKLLPAVSSLPGLRRGTLMTAMLLAVAVNSAEGIAVLFRPGPSDDAYRRLTTELRAAGPVDATVLLTDAVPALDLAFAMRASAPDAAMIVAPSWDDAAAEFAARFGETPPKATIVTWGDPAGGIASADDLRPIGDPLLFEGRTLLMYVSAGEPAGSSAADR